MTALSPRRAERARPHWLVIDEAHQLLPSEWNGFAVFTQRALDIRAATGRNRPEKVAVLDRGVERVLIDDTTSRDALISNAPGFINPRQPTLSRRGTEGSNLAPSSGESDVNLTSSIRDIATVTEGAA